MLIKVMQLTCLETMALLALCFINDTVSWLGNSICLRFWTTRKLIVNQFEASEAAEACDPGVPVHINMIHAIAKVLGRQVQPRYLAKYTCRLSHAISDQLQTDSLERSSHNAALVV